MQAIAQAAAALGLVDQGLQGDDQGVQVGPHRVDAQGFDRLVDEVDGRFHMHAQAQQGRGDGLDALREHPFERSPGRTRRPQVGCGDQVGHRLGLDQVELAVEECALAELARTGRARTQLAATLHQPPQQHRAAVSLQFGHVFAGETVRARERQHQAVVDRFACGVGEGCAPGASWQQGVPAQALGDPQCLRAGQSHDAHATGAGRGGDRRYRVVARAGVHRHPVRLGKNPPLRRVPAGWMRAAGAVTSPGRPLAPARRASSSSTTAAAGRAIHW